MTRSIFVAAVLAALTSPAAFAVEPALGARLGTGPGEISAALGESGYALTKFARENGDIALIAVKDGLRVEAYLDAESGALTRLESRGRRGPWPLPGVDDGALRAQLEADGYRIVEYQRGRGRIEVRADRAGRHWELKIDPRDGRIAGIEAEDD